MGGRVDLVQSVSQHTYCLKTLLQGVAMGTGVYAVSQSADNQHVRTLRVQVGDEATDEVLSVGGGMARAHHVENVTLVEVGTALIVEEQGRIGTFTEALGVGIVAQGQHADAVVGDELHLGSCPVQGIVPVAHGLAQAGCGLRDYVADIVAMVIDRLAAAQCLIEVQGHLLTEARDTGQCYGIIGLFACHDGHKGTEKNE